ncbi:MAG: glutamine synthetase type III, partial [Clostridia bacterium]|nr:glutamine synthetase type III [Clostridia bacterium]
TNIATDHNQLTMELMRKIAAKHGMVCLLHEKPFAGVNGSGKHNNWSISTDTGVNLLEPGDTPDENAQFLLFLAAVIKAVDEYQDLLRISVASAGNDHRLGANEAPPAVVSIFLGDELQGVLDAIEQGKHYDKKQRKQLKIGVDVLPKFPTDTTDRNRTSPFAFTGNKFEFRMLGSSASIADANVMLNAAVAESLRVFADRLEGARDFEGTLHEMLRETIRAHRRIIFNGNGYDGGWIKEATEVRGLLNYRTTVDCLPHLLDRKNVGMLTSHRVFSEEELRSRCEIMLENYAKTVTIEARTMADMAKTLILPAVRRYAADVAAQATMKRGFDPSLSCAHEAALVGRLSDLSDAVAGQTQALEDALLSLHGADGIVAEAERIRDTVLPRMSELRIACDEAETLTAKSYWPFPTYGDILFSVR